ncbi:MAG: hypothetical protein QM778_23940 [Myxococcales bacterium]
MAEDERIKLYQAEIARLDELDAHLDHLWTRVPRYGLFAVAAPFVGYFKGFGWAVATILTTAALVGTQAYLIRMRKSENRWTRRRLTQDIALREQELAAGKK